MGLPGRLVRPEKPVEAPPSPAVTERFCAFFRLSSSPCSLPGVGACSTVTINLEFYRLNYQFSNEINF
jgi:hypothetical protein